MKSTGIVRKIDELGRVVLPMSIRNSLGIAEKDPLEIYVDGERIILQKYNPACLFCGDADGIVYFGDRRICKACLQKLKKL